MKTNYTVYAQSFDRVTGKETAEERGEEINIKTNALFRGVKSLLDIKKAYESFWNELNPSSKDMVFVKRIV